MNKILNVMIVSKISHVFDCISLVFCVELVYFFLTYSFKSIIQLKINYFILVWKAQSTTSCY